MSVHMRSNDLVKGVPYDWAFFMYLQERMLRELQVKHSALKIGTYTHSVGSMHLYESDFELARKMIGHGGT